MFKARVATSLRDRVLQLERCRRCRTPPRKCNLDPDEVEMLLLLEQPVAFTPVELEYLRHIEQRHGITLGLITRYAECELQRDRRKRSAFLIFHASERVDGLNRQFVCAPHSQIEDWRGSCRCFVANLFHLLHKGVDIAKLSPRAKGSLEAWLYMLVSYR